MGGSGSGGRSRGAVLGAALGASIGIPAGLLQDYLVTMLPPDHQRQRQLKLQQTEDIIAGQGEKERKKERKRERWLGATFLGWS